MKNGFTSAVTWLAISLAAASALGLAARVPPVPQEAASVHSVRDRVADADAGRVRMVAAHVQSYGEDALVAGESADGGTRNTAFTPKTYTYRVHFEKNADDATGTMNDQTFTFGRPQALSEVGFSRAGYTFAGWTTDAAGAGRLYVAGERVANLSSEALEAVTMYAQWTANSGIPYLVQHVMQRPDGSYPDTPDETETFTGVAGEETAAHAKSYEGFTAGDVVQQRIAGNGSTVVRIDYERNGYTVTFDANGHGAVVDPQTVKFGVHIPKPADAPVDGWLFGGWYIDQAGAEPWDFDLMTMPAHDLTLYAKWIEVVAEPERAADAMRPVDDGSGNASAPTNPSDAAAADGSEATNRSDGGADRQTESTRPAAPAERARQTDDDGTRSTSLAHTGVAGATLFIAASLLACAGATMRTMRKRR